MNERRTSVPGEAAQLPVLAQFLQEFWSAAELPPTQSLPFEIALEEIFMNVVLHGSPEGQQGRVEVCLALDEDNFTLAVEDDGPPFDPLTVAAPDTHAPLEDRRVGGLGVYFVRQMMDAVSYTRVGPRNQLRMTKHVAR
jgi:anti-sigma regulatory factor (Ser/Thr protein kinase)